MAAVGVDEAPGAIVQHTVENSHEQLLGIVLLQEVVDARQDATRLVHVSSGGGAYHRAGHDHEQTGRYALARNVGHDHADAVPVEMEEIVEIPTDLLGLAS